MPIHGVIFDMDGVLIDSAAAHLQSWRRLADEIGRSITDEQFRASFGRQNFDIIPAFFGADLSRERVVELGERKEAVYRDIVRGRVPAMPGAAELVRACRDDGLRLAVGSSGHPLNIHLALEEMGILECFDVLISGADVARGKPDPQVFLLAADGLQLPAPDCVVIEDAPSGVAAARAASMYVVAVTSTHPPKAFPDADLVVATIGDLTPRRLRRLGRDYSPL